ncbi:MAG: endonuclease III [Alphaproteobacteria bacterium]|nr:endonuclease III [Alphaproteobacteria bacterium]MCR4556058.1 endonuclease III [Alphaproteobacteria bacterium]
MQKNNIEEICRILSETIKFPKSELKSFSDYSFLMAVVMSAQTTDVQVNKVTDKLFKKYKTIDDFLNLGEKNLAKEISSIGLYRNKAKNIIGLLKILKEKYNGRVPNSREALESLPGVGRKSANVVLNELFDQPTIAVDTHVLRLTNVMGISTSNNPLQVEKDLERAIPEKYKRNISNYLVLHGRYVCKARKPDCDHCQISEICPKIFKK